MEWTHGFCKGLFSNCSLKRRILFLMWACICSATYYCCNCYSIVHYYHWLSFLGTTNVELAMSMKTPGRQQEQQRADVTHSENIDVASCKTKFKNVHWCLSIKEPKQNLVTDIMLKAWWHLNKTDFSGCFYCHPRKCVVLHVSISFLLGLKAT